MSITENQSISKPLTVANPLNDHALDIAHGDVDQTAQESTNSSNNTNNTNGAENPHTKRELRGAAVAGGLVGLVIGGPVLGLIAAGGAALAVTNKGKAGEVARSGGEAVACIGDRLKKIDKKHRMAEKTGKTITKGFDWAAKRIKPRDADPSQAGSSPVRPVH